MIGCVIDLVAGNPKVKPNTDACTGHTKQEVEARLKYHGALQASCDNGTWVFYRDGQKIKLFKEKSSH